MTRSLVLITVDCLRSDHVGFLGYRRATTPFLDTLAKQSFVFSNAFVAGAPTYYSLPAMLASRYPLALGRDVVGLAPGEPNLASVLESSGYATAAFNAGNPYLSARFGYSEGFEVFRDFLDVSLPTRRGGEANHSGVLARWNERLQRFSKSVGLGSLYDDLYFQYAQRLRARRPDSFDELRRFPAADVLVDEATKWLESVGE